MAKFKLFEDKSSMDNQLGRYVQGGETEVFEKRLGWWDRKELPEPSINDTIYTIKPEEESRPDITSNKFYERADLDWFILQYNNIVDINEEYVVGKQIFLPSRTRLFYEILVEDVI